MSHHETAIIGAGPYGLSLAAHVRHRGLGYELFGLPMRSWNQFMPKGMLLKSEGFASNLWDSRCAFTSPAEVVGDRARLILNGAHGVEIIDTDAVIAGTGFKADIDRLTLLSASLRAEIAREGCAPKLSPGFETSVQNLHIVGILSAPTFGPVMRFMFGAKHAAPMVTRRIAAWSLGVADATRIDINASPARLAGKR
jgi:hypothetical protein